MPTARIQLRPTAHTGRPKIRSASVTIQCVVLYDDRSFSVAGPRVWMSVSVSMSVSRNAAL